MSNHQYNLMPAFEKDADEAASESPRRILIVEDEPDLAALLAYRLKQENYSTVISEDGIHACRLVDDVRPDLVLLDILLHGKNGWQVCEYIRTHDEKAIAAIPVIMLTALAGTPSKLKGLELGADAYIHKPYSVKEILLQCNRLIADREQKRALQEELDHVRALDHENINLQSILFHELFNHLIIIGVFCKRLQKNIAQGKTEKNLVCLDKIEKSVGHLTSVSDEMLLIRKIESGEISMPREEFDLGKVVHDITNLYQQHVKSKGIRLLESIAPAVNISANKVAIRLISSNLLENAIKYCANGSQVKVETKVNLETKQAVIVVTDNGPGIPETEQKKIFERFYRGESIRDSTKGSGTGLFAVKKLTEALGGNIMLTSSEGKGCSFKLELNLQPQ